MKKVLLFLLTFLPSFNFIHSFTYSMADENSTNLHIAGDGLANSSGSVSVGAGTGITVGSDISVDESANLDWTGSHSFGGVGFTTNGQVTATAISRPTAGVTVPTSLTQFGPTFSSITVGSNQIVKLYVVTTIAGATPSLVDYRVEYRRDNVAIDSAHGFLSDTGSNSEYRTVTAVFFDNPGAGTYTYTFFFSAATDGSSAIQGGALGGYAYRSDITYEVVNIDNLTDTTENW